MGGGVDAGQIKVCKTSRSDPNHEKLYVMVKILDSISQVTEKTNEKVWVTLIRHNKICQCF